MISFELRIRFRCPEGDEMPVWELRHEIEHMVLANANVLLHPTELYVIDRNCREGRKHAARD
jgi:hypothetical protein